MEILLDYNGMKLLVYQDFEKAPFMTIDESNPTLSEVELNHRLQSRGICK